MRSGNSRKLSIVRYSSEKTKTNKNKQARLIENKNGKILNTIIYIITYTKHNAYFRTSRYMIY